MSKIHEALLKAEQKAEQDSGTRHEAPPNAIRVPKPVKLGVRFSALEAFQNEKRPIKIDFDLDPFLEEQYQKLRRRLTPSKQSDVKVIMVAATTHGEGATTTSAILASTLARSGHSRILLIDANMRTPALDSVFDGAPSDRLPDCRISSPPMRRLIRQFIKPISRTFFCCRWTALSLAGLFVRRRPDYEFVERSPGAV